MKRLMIVRHGESEWNASRRLQGQADIELSDKGREQALALRATVEALNPDTSITSDLKRAIETARLLGIEAPLTNPALREIDVGEWTGRAIADIRADDAEGYQGWRSGTVTPKGGEKWSEFVSRTSTCVMTSLQASDRLLVVCHGGVIRALLEKLIDLPPQRIIPVGPASLTVLAERPSGSGSMRLELFNYSPLGPVLDAPD
ncbi:histidine phosphatase family protein [Pelagibacterium nitratireducens]|jgi:glucosyl-3-phosphoglycerate phosphatase|uniref:Histidine phosphatase family protein n=1 Tax=Pelagibacterium nitratireducens TaxID=1046114 RepID=A0ABZ2I9Q0_9HYPH|tara:strand:- start:3631 stop:4236 length:606 start_codon:yes stop_codon:yes gene_type:complete